MPIFEYVCQRCHHQFEELVFGENPKVKCPKCHKSRVTRQLSVFGFKSGSSFVGSGSKGGCGPCTPSSCSSCH